MCWKGQVALRGRKSTYYFIIVLLFAIALLFLVAVYNIWLMLLLLLIMVLIAGIIHQKRLGGKRSNFSLFPHQSQGILSTNNGASLFVPHIILVDQENGASSQIVIDNPDFTLGRNPDCDYEITGQRYISGVHAVLRFDVKHQRTYIIDNNSHNGTFVNNKRLTPQQPEPLHEGDVIQIGTARFKAQAAHF